MRVLHLNQYGHYVGGCEGYIAEVHGGLMAAGHSSLLAYCEPETGAPLVRESLSMLAAGSEVLTRRRLASELRRVALDYAPDVVYVHTIRNPGAISYLAKMGTPMVVYVHSQFPVCPGDAYYLRRSQAPCKRAFGPSCLTQAQVEKCCWGRNPVRHAGCLIRCYGFRGAYRHANRLIVGSEYMREILVRNQYAPQRIGILPPVLLREPYPMPAANADSRLLLFAARIVPEKGLSVLLKALAIVENEWELVVAGDGDQKAICADLAARLGIASRVHFAGWLGPNDMSAALQACAFVVIPSLWPEPFGRLGPEAALCGKPAVAFRVGGIPSWLVDGETGYLAGQGNIRELAKAIDTLLEDRDLRLEMGRRARDRAEALWGADRHIAELLRIFQEAVSSGRV
jgi:glycosyltransferase involved in cell wall biosynthesis